MRRTAFLCSGQLIHAHPQLFHKAARRFAEAHAIQFTVNIFSIQQNV